MQKNRIEQLKQMLADEPGDLFLKYALALEYKSLGDNLKAEKYFYEILEIDENYLPVYYQLAKLKESRDEKKEAIALYKRGIDKAKMKNDKHTQSELQTSLNILTDEDEF